VNCAVWTANKLQTNMQCKNQQW